MPTPKREALSEEEVGNKKKFNVKYKRTQKAVGKADEVFDEESPFYAETLEEAKEIAQNTLGEQDGIDVDSITVEEFVEPTVDPLDDTTLSNQEKVQAYYESLTDEELERMIKNEETAAFSLEQFKSLKDEVTKPDVYEAELAQKQKSYERTKKNAERAKAVLESRKQKPVDTVDPQETGAEIPIGVFGDVDLETVPGLTPQQKQKILELRQEANAGARKLFGALDDPTGELDAEAVVEGLKALQEISEDGTVGATSAQKQTLDKIREIERRTAEVLGREYIPRTDSSIVREIERTIVTPSTQRAATGALFVGATMSPVSSEFDSSRTGTSKKGTKARPVTTCLLYTSPSPRDGLLSRMPSSA